ncbi:MAG: hypothetical protein DRR19_14980 [Candidatus Parabeggiatoa sp. nov. 1]|nr:MAG: hypothetical protein DRR19_14980 [Gammaproteobacteria bacterium]
MTWIYEGTKEQPTLDQHTEQSDVPIVGPSAQQAAMLFKYTKMGDVNAIIDSVKELEQAEPQLAPFACENKENS